MNVFGIGLPEMAVIAVIGLLVFGPKRLPELGKTLGRTLRGFQSASQEFEREFRSAIAVEGEPEPSSAATLAASAEVPASAVPATAADPAGAAVNVVEADAKAADSVQATAGDGVSV